MSKFAIDSHKIQYHTDRIEQWKADPLNTFPLYVEISPVGHCNHRCTFCAVDYIGYKNRRIEKAVLDSTIPIMAANGVRSIMFAGEGEPLLHPDITEITRFTKKSGIDVAFTTNATAMTQKFVEQGMPYASWIKVSCNAGDAETYAKIHQTNARDWDRVWNNIGYAISYRKANDIKTTIGVQALLLPDNAESLNNLAKTCRNMGVDYLVIKPYSHHLASQTTKYKDIEYRDFYNKTIEALKMYACSTFEIVAREASMASWDASERGYSKCYSTPYFWAYVMASGDVYGCSAYLQDERFCYGNINTQGFQDIWLGAKRRASMEYVDKHLDISECRKNCRMDKVNRFLWDIKNPGEHRNFI